VTVTVVCNGHKVHPPADGWTWGMGGIMTVSDISN